jgi:hypothetical protein
MTMDELMAQILEILPNAVFGEETESGEIVIATGLLGSTDELKEID